MSKKFNLSSHHNQDQETKTDELDGIKIDLTAQESDKVITRSEHHQFSNIIVENFEDSPRGRHRSESLESIDQIPEPQESPKSRDETRLEKIFTMFHRPRAKGSDVDTQDKLIKEYKEQLNDSLKLYRTTVKSDPSSINSETYYQYGLIYKKLARISEILPDPEQDTDYATNCRQKAIGYFNKAITLGNKYNSSSNEDLAKYHSAKAKAYYYMKDFNKAKNECADSMSFCPTNLKAHEVMGYIYKAEKQYNLALKSFNNSAGDQKHNIHYVMYLYNKCQILAMLGKQEEATSSYNLANSISLSQNLDMEDKIIALGMRNPSYGSLIIELSNLSSKKELLDTPHNASIKNIFSDIEINNSPNEVARLLDEVRVIKETLIETEKALKDEKLSYLNDAEKLKKALRRLESDSNEESEIDSKNIIHSDPYLSTFYKGIKQHLLNTYNTTQSIDTGLVANNKTGNLGNAAKALNLVNDFLPAPKVVSLPLKAASLGLAAMDEHYQAKCIENFNNIADDERDMKIFSKDVATKLTLQRKDEILNQTTKHNTSDIKKLAKFDAANTAKFIEEIIFDGRITADTLTDKVNMIVALVGINTDYYNANLENIPPYTKSSATQILEKIKAQHHHWHSNEKLEKQFINRLSEEINKSGLQENVVKGEHFITSLAYYIIRDTHAVETVNRTLKFWEQKGKLSEDFLSSVDYFKDAIMAIFDTSAVTSVVLSDNPREDTSNIMPVLIGEDNTDNNSDTHL